MKLSIIIPVYNEAATVEALLKAVWEQPLTIDRELVIIESASEDNTRAIVKAFSDRANQQSPGAVKLVLQPQAKGKGNALREGFRAATGDLILIQDGDLEYDVRDYPTLLKPLIGGEASFVLGSRHLAAGTWKIRSFQSHPIKSWFFNLGGIFFHGLFNLLYGQRLTDPTTMYKVFRKDCLNDLRLESNRFDFDYELTAKLIRSGHKPMEIAVSYKSRSFAEGKKIRVFRDPFTWLWAIFKFRFSPLYV